MSQIDPFQPFKGVSAGNEDPEALIEPTEVDARLDALIAGHNDLEAELAPLFAYRPILTAAVWVRDNEATPAGWFSAEGTFGDVDIITSPTPRSIYFAAADYAIAGKATKLRLRAQLFTNQVAPGVSPIVGLHAINSSFGSSGNLGIGTVSAAVTGSTVTFVAPATSSRLSLATSDFDPPSDGWYIPVINADIASGANLLACVQLYVRWV